MYTGSLTTTRQGTASQYPAVIDLPVTSSSSFNGTFADSNSLKGTIDGTILNDAITFTAAITGNCAGSFAGTITTTDSNTFSLTGQGSDCKGPVVATAQMARLLGDGIFGGKECTDLSGRFFAGETASVTCALAGQPPETVTESGQGTVDLTENDCNVSYTVPGINVSRSGPINGDTLSLTGPFVIAQPDSGSTVVFTQNSVTISGQITGDSRVDLTGTGFAAGTIDGSSFTCSGNSTGQLNRNSHCDFSSEDGQPERCFGGVGKRCEGIDILGVQVVRFFKHEDSCTVDGQMSGGSILHDNCCYRTGNAGYNCVTLGQGNGECVDEWREAKFDVPCGRDWSSTFGPYPLGNSGDNTDIFTNLSLRAPPGARINNPEQNGQNVDMFCQDGRCISLCQSGVCKPSILPDVCGYSYCTCQ